MEKLRISKLIPFEDYRWKQSGQHSEHEYVSIASYYPSVRELNEAYDFISGLLKDSFSFKKEPDFIDVFYLAKLKGGLNFVQDFGSMAEKESLDLLIESFKLTGNPYKKLERYDLLSLRIKDLMFRV